MLRRSFKLTTMRKDCLRSNPLRANESTVRGLSTKVLKKRHSRTHTISSMQLSSLRNTSNTSNKVKGAKTFHSFAWCSITEAFEHAFVWSVPMEDHTESEIPRIPDIIPNRILPMTLIKWISRGLCEAG
ncbi:hypothetical protein M0802_003229 [Mischocyttarus mexicanus]|nr:hypothetical protein M0802_003229 [Mischocyttarus mexicanus]